MAKRSASLEALLKPLIAAPAELEDVQTIRDSFGQLCKAMEAVREAEQAYAASSQPLHEALRDVIDSQGDSAGWQDFIDLSRDLAGLRSAMIDSTIREQVRAELKAALKQIDGSIEKVLDDKFETLSKTIDEWWSRLRGSEPTFFSAVKRRGRNTIDFKGGLSAHRDHADPKFRDVIAVFSDSQLHCLGLAIFLARGEHYGMPFVVLDDPVLSSDEDYRAHFRTRVVGRLHELGIQTIILTQHKATRRDIVSSNEHRGVNQFQIEILEPAKGSVITKTGDELSAMLASSEAFTTTDAVQVREEGGRRLRIATERFCKALLVKQRLAAGQFHAAISDYEGQMLGGNNGLVQQTLPYLTVDESHPGKLRTINNDLNPPSHDDDDIPSRQALRDALGNLRRFVKDYLT